MNDQLPAETMNQPYDVFLSHNSKDKPAVETLAVRLMDEARIKVWLDKWNLIPGEPWQEEIERALDQAQTCAVFLGPSGFGGWHHEEMRAALDQRVADRTRKFRVIPVLLPGATMPARDKLPRFLSRLTWVDFRAGLDDPEAFQRLVAGIRGHAPGRLGTVSPMPVAPRKDRKWIVAVICALILIAILVIAMIPRNRPQVAAPTAKPTTETATLSGTILDHSEQPIQGALVTLDDLPGMKPVETDSDGKFTVKDIPKPWGEEVKIRVIKEGYQPNPYTEGNIVLGKRPPRITLTRKQQ